MTDTYIFLQVSGVVFTALLHLHLSIGQGVDPSQSLKVTLNIPPSLTNGVGVNVSCSVLHGAGAPPPVVVRWRRQQAPLQLVKPWQRDIPGGTEHGGLVVPLVSWNGSTLTCEVNRDGGAGEAGTVWAADSRVINVVGSSLKLRAPRSSNPAGSSARSKFEVEASYPAGQQPATIILQPGARFNFTCATSEPWQICKWLTPLSPHSCVMVHDRPFDDCRFDGLAHSDFRLRYEVDRGLHHCNLSGTLGTSRAEQGKWSCDLESFQKERAQQSFSLQLLKKPTLSFSFSVSSRENKWMAGREAEMFEAESLDVSCTARGAFPKAEIVWFFNTQLISFPSQTFTLIKQDGPREDPAGEFYHRQDIRYQASLDHNGRTLSCRSRQYDDENNLSEVTDDSNAVQFYIKAIPDPPPSIVTAELVGSIVGVVVALLLAMLLLAFALYTKRWCFAVPVVVMGVSKDKETGEMIIQTEEEEEKAAVGRHEMSIGTEAEPLLGKQLDTQTDCDGLELCGGGIVRDKQAEANFSNDQILKFEYEGGGSLANSLSSLCSSSDSSVHWDQEFRALGPRFRHLADLCGGESEEEENAGSAPVGRRH